MVFGLVFLSPIAPVAIYGVGTVMTRGHLALAYAIAMVAMLFTALSYGRMASAYPVAGSSYSYVRRAINPHLGFLTGWMMFLDYVLIPLQINIVGALFAHNLVPEIPYWGWVLIFSTFISYVNHRGITVTNSVNFIMTGLMFAALFSFVVAAVWGLTHGVGKGTLISLFPFFNPDEFSLVAVLSGVGLVVLSYLGFDAITTMAEEAHNPERDIPRAALIIMLVGGGLFVMQAYLATLIFPNYTEFTSTGTAFAQVLQAVGGKALSTFVSVIFVFSVVAGGVAGQVGASRLLFGMGRDGVLPKRVFGYVHPRYQTPTWNILILFALSVSGALILSLSLASEIVSFGAISGFMLVNLSVIALYYIRRRRRREWIKFLLFPALGFVVTFIVWIDMSPRAKQVGFSWLIIGVIYLAIMTRGFRKRPRELGDIAPS